ncbi:PepSY domain-containing protein [Motilimonas eburnea]|uniref:PepSY domain-containing protein n=1 Tax=Motilimonas eburnea TaxID=1737488 RepID=UPI001E2BEEA2|nr:PepSY domain-containing protein [Motilimonas eburnea]MCE2572985.1 PepSY domain-containing protein [Motilimonas eburnea]
MSSRKIHKIIGLVLILPMLGWTITGMIFFIKPGYQGAYEQLPVKTYPLEIPLIISPDSTWQEARLLRSVLGHHLLVTIEGKVKHLDPVSFVEKSPPTTAELKKLIEDAVTVNHSRYGNRVEVNENGAVTNTGIEIKLDWQNLKLMQMGQDTQLINLMYRIHYLQWTPIKEINQVLGVLGLVLLISLTVLGIRIYIKNKG